MYNTATIYRFNTPFLDVHKERIHIISVEKKIEKLLEFDWINFEKTTTREWNYYKIELLLTEKLWKIVLYYIYNIKKNSYYLPVFKLDIFLNNNFLLTNPWRQRAVKFLNNIFECFDWLTEKDFLIDLDNTLYYTKWMFNSKYYPNYDFSDIEKIRWSFETNDGLALVEDFINKFSDTNFILSYEKSNYYYELHSIFLYFIYLIYLMYQNIESSKNIQEDIHESKTDGIFDWNIELFEKRLSYIKDINGKIFEQYENKLETFFKMF